MKLKKIFLALLVILVVVIGGFLFYVETHYEQSFSESLASCERIKSEI